ncbi:COX15/CtaA family protein [Flavobacterium difficile]|uniref:Heme A synthase n=1 Tax=Flavobacterium difficile TaxID=2709659 RepID=A0ABX0I437_9FLAO|nr:COX15/CtaA family protein [Flavobacterium difficile]NHM01337.1 heme A synthase [Flavobacterium difficile]
MKKYFLTAAKTALVLVYLVILAGALVRMTGSGMGCPDWPKCFGYYIPPTEQKELEFTPNKSYDEGQVIIKNEGLLVAKSDFISTTTFSESDWEPYTKHDYAIFNAAHTWIEYINRLFGALAGLACVVTFILAFGYWKENKKIVIYSFLVCVLMGFQAWLGKTVVDSVLNPVKITTHMLAAFLIVALQLYVIYVVSVKNTIRKYDKKFNLTIVVVLLLTVVQVVLGTYVREFIDTVEKSGAPKELWLLKPELTFYFHRSFSIVVFLANLYLLLRNKNLQLGFEKVNWIVRILLFEIISGVIMVYVDFPFGSQTLHLVLATFLFSVQFYLFLESKTKPSK